MNGQLLCSNIQPYTHTIILIHSSNFYLLRVGNLAHRVTRGHCTQALHSMHSLASIWCGKCDSCVFVCMILFPSFWPDNFCLSRKYMRIVRFNLLVVLSKTNHNFSFFFAWFLAINVLELSLVCFFMQLDFYHMPNVFLDTNKHICMNNFFKMIINNCLCHDKEERKKNETKC